MIDDVIDPRETRADDLPRAGDGGGQADRAARGSARGWCRYEQGGVVSSRPRRHHLLDLGRDRQPRAVPGDPLHARGVRRRGAPDRRRGRRDDPHPRAQTGRHAELRDRGLRTRSPRRSAREVGDEVIVNFSTGTIGVPVEKRIDYLRACRPEVAALNMGSMNYAKYSRSRKEFVFNMVFANPFDGDHRAARGDERARHQTRARVLRHRPRRQPRAADRHGRAARRRCTSTA